MTPSPDRDLVSVIIPTFNSERWIAETLGSVLGQTDARYEVVVADNGSTDRTLSIVRATLPDARIVHAATRGPSAARNAGLDAARGEFIQFLDSDDLLSPVKLESQRACLEESGADVSWGGWARLYRNSMGAFTREVRYRPRIGGDAAACMLSSEGFIPLGGVMVRRTERTIGARFDTAFHVVEDIRYLQGLALGGARFEECVEPAIGFWLREHDAPHRASAVAAARFWEACAANAETVYRHWIALGEELGRERVDVLTRALLEAAEILAIHGDERLDQVLEILESVDPNYTRRMRMPHRMLAPLVGYRRTIGVAEAVKALCGRTRSVHQYQTEE